MKAGLRRYRLNDIDQKGRQGQSKTNTAGPRSYEIEYVHEAKIETASLNLGIWRFNWKASKR